MKALNSEPQPSTVPSLHSLSGLTPTSAIYQHESEAKISKLPSTQFNLTRTTMAETSNAAVAESLIPSIPVSLVTLLGSKPLEDVSPQEPSGKSEVQASGDSPVPLSFPAILRNPKLADRYAYLRERPVAVQPKTSLSKARRDEREGKRWIRRRENGALQYLSCGASAHPTHAPQPILRIILISRYPRAMIIRYLSPRNYLRFQLHYRPAFLGRRCYLPAFLALGTPRVQLQDYFLSR